MKKLHFLILIALCLILPILALPYGIWFCCKYAGKPERVLMLEDGTHLIEGEVVK